MSSPAPWRPSRRFLIGVCLVVLSNAALPFSVAHFHYFGRQFLAVGLLFAAVALWVRREAMTTPVRLIVALAVVIQLPGVVMPPLTSDDAYRYVWDGRVQLAGINPYRYVPLDQALRPLRDATLFPGGSPLINRPSVPTIYPPVAQLWFTMIAMLTPRAWGTAGVQLAAGAAVVMTTWLLARFLGRRRGLALLYGASPAVMIEAGSGAHLDALTALLVLGVGREAVARRHWVAGLFLGLAAGVKLVPLLLAPVFITGRRWRTSLTASLVLVAAYVPHVLALSGPPLGFLPGYLEEEGYFGTSRFALLIWLPVSVRTVAAVIAALLLAALAVYRSGREPVLVTCCWLYGAAFLVGTPIYSWYALPLVVLAIMANRLEWLAVWAATYVAFVFDREVYVQALGYGLALVVVLIGAWRRRGASAAGQGNRPLLAVSSTRPTP